MKHAVILGDNSDLAIRLRELLVKDHWAVSGWNRKWRLIPDRPWDLCLIAIGVVAPVGHWRELDHGEFDGCIESNLLLPIRLLRKLWPSHKPDASVCFMAGSNPQRIMPGYAPYNIGKMALLKAVEQIDAEETDVKVFALAPGYVRTKIHAASLKAIAAGRLRNEVIQNRQDGTPIERIYGALQWCLAQEKRVVGGRNICASDPWDTEHFLAARLAQHPAMWKLRRTE